MTFVTSLFAVLRCLQLENFGSPTVLFLFECVLYLIEDSRQFCEHDCGDLKLLCSKYSSNICFKKTLQLISWQHVAHSFVYAVDYFPQRIGACHPLHKQLRNAAIIGTPVKMPVKKWTAILKRQIIFKYFSNKFTL